ncbi:MAG: exopolyphosphatase, partial [Methyloligellaceae bacterium]
MKHSNGQNRPTLKPVAVIDIGSNSVRLVVFEGAKRNPVPLFNEKVLCGLGRSVASTGRLDGDGVERALRALRRFRAISDQLNAERIEVIATAAAREAENGPDFVARAKRVLETDISVISGKEEAHLAAAGVISGFPDAAGLAGDLGGGSLEIIGIHKNKDASGGITLPL